MDNESKTQIKILVPIRYPVGGIRTYIKYTYGKLDREKYCFDFIAPQQEWLERINSDLKNFKVNIFPTPSGNINKMLLFSIFKRLRSGGYDLIHSQGYTAGILSNIANIFYGNPHILTIHHIFGHGQHSDTYWNNFASIKKIILQAILSKIDIIQTVSNDAKENLIEYFPGLKKKPSKIVTILNGIDVDAFISDIGLQSQVFHKESGIFYIGFIGRYMPEKGFLQLIESMDQIVNNLGIKDIRILSAGDFGGFFREYKKLIDSKNLKDYFIFIDFLENISPFLKKIDLLAIPSLGEACPLAPMEGLVCGTPLIAFRCIGLREVLSGTPATLVETNNIASFVDAILHHKNNYPKIKADSIEYQSKAISRFDSKITAIELDRLFNSVLSIDN